MRTYLLILFMLVTIPFCQKHKKQSETDKLVIDSLLSVPNQYVARFMLSTFLGIDSVADADNYFMNSNIDSIASEKLRFEAIYLTCFRAVVREENYQYLRGYAPSEYKKIMAITTQHSVLVDGKEYSFNGIGDIGCRGIPDSTKVSIDSKVYSLFSGKKPLGKLIILEAIKKIDKPSIH